MRYLLAGFVIVLGLTLSSPAEACFFGLFGHSHGHVHALSLHRQAIRHHRRAARRAAWHGHGCAGVVHGCAGVVIDGCSGAAVDPQ